MLVLRKCIVSFHYSDDASRIANITRITFRPTSKGMQIEKRRRRLGGQRGPQRTTLPFRKCTKAPNPKALNAKNNHSPSVLITLTSRLPLEALFQSWPLIPLLGLITSLSLSNLVIRRRVFHGFQRSKRNTRLLRATE